MREKILQTTVAKRKINKLVMLVDKPKNMQKYADHGRSWSSGGGEKSMRFIQNATRVLHDHGMKNNNTSQRR